MFRKRHPPPGAPPGTLVTHPGASPTRLLLIDYGPDTVQERSLSSLDDLPPPISGRVRWLCIQGLGDEPLLRALGEHFHVHPLALADVVNTPQRPKLDPYPDHALLITRAAHLDTRRRIGAEQISIVLFAGCVLSFEERQSELLDPVRERIRRRGLIVRGGADLLAQAIVDTVVDRYYPLLEEVGEELEAIERDVLDQPTRRILHRLHYVKTGLLTLRRGIYPQRDAIQAVLRRDSELFSAESIVYFRDSYDHAAQVVDVLESFRDIAAGLMDVYLTTINNRAGEVMKVLTVIATIFIPLTFLVGIYGMNFVWMPELHFWWAYPLLWAIMLAIATLMLVNFKRRGWLERQDTIAPEPSTKSGPHRHAPGRHLH